MMNWFSTWWTDCSMQKRPLVQARKWLLVRGRIGRLSQRNSRQRIKSLESLLMLKRKNWGTRCMKNLKRHFFYIWRIRSIQFNMRSSSEASWNLISLIMKSVENLFQFKMYRLNDWCSCLRHRTEYTEIKMSRDCKFRQKFSRLLQSNHRFMSFSFCNWDLSQNNSFCCFVNFMSEFLWNKNLTSRYFTSYE